jgi:hypothetical protein
MFKVGDTVRNASRNVVGVVVEIDGDTVYIEQANGAEVDFEASNLVLENEFQAKHDTSVRTDAGSQQFDPIYDAVVSNLYPAVVEIGLRALADAEQVPGVAPKRWDGLSALQKLNVISDATNVPVKAWIDANQAGANPSLGKLQLSILGNLGPKN